MKAGQWEPLCPACGLALRPVLTKESDPFRTTSVYGVTKMGQEELALTTGAAYGIPTVALRFFNVYGPGQSLSNPYTGVAAIFMSRLKNRRAPVIYEDGLQSRDFTSVHDVVQAVGLALRGKPGAERVFNVGTGVTTTILDIARLLARALKVEIAPKALNKFRTGDIRHCGADIRRIGAALGYRPKVALEEGLSELVDWAASVDARDGFERAQRELARRGLV